MQERSDDMTPACDAVALPWVLRKAMVLINDLELADSDTQFETRLKAGGVLDVRECYPWTGEVSPSMGRLKHAAPATNYKVIWKYTR